MPGAGVAVRSLKTQALFLGGFADIYVKKKKKKSLGL